MLHIDPCKKCPILNGTIEFDYDKTPCRDNNGLFLGFMMVSLFTCKYANKQNKTILNKLNVEKIN